MIIGTNDYRLGRTLSNFYTALTSWVQAYKAALPDTALVLIAHRNVTRQEVIRFPHTAM
ncbi:hypothetical protein [Klebsiella pneumoniae]|uniref:hypothetical protein n=1 Tax=Klebsiella pneumoniae TaxID=573 RepID=UPI00163DABEA|nr:hypothetical protein [Klebsiella pneumoniae]